MRALVLHKCFDLQTEENPLVLEDLPVPQPKKGELLLRVHTCGICHTELDEIEGRTPPPHFPMVLGHQVVGIVTQTGEGAKRYKVGTRVGVGWIHSACGECEYCLAGNENLCPRFLATGRDVNGGYAEYMTAPEAFAVAIPTLFSDEEAAPLLCAGAIGYRSLRLTNLSDRQNLGLMGFGASAHLVLKLVRHLYPKSRTFVFARSEKERQFALEIGAHWSGEITEMPPQELNCIIDTTPAWKPVVAALSFLKPGGRLVINAIRKEAKDQEIWRSLSYENHLWLEKEIKSVANITRQDIFEFLSTAARISLKPETQIYALEEANSALLELKTRKIRGAKVLKLV